MAGKHSRQYAKRSARRLYQSVDRSMAKVKVLHEMFSDGKHESHVQMLKLIAQSMIFVQQFIVEFYVQTWGAEPGNWYADLGH